MSRNARELAEKSYVQTHWGNEGRDQDRTLRCADPDDLYFTVLGELFSVTYDTAKGRAKLPELYEHEFHSPKPVLCYSPKSRLLLIAGGIYTVTARGIER